jgi:hypothetical protein
MILGRARDSDGRVIAIGCFEMADSCSKMSRLDPCALKDSATTQKMRGSKRRSCFGDVSLGGSGRDALRGASLHGVQSPVQSSPARRVASRLFAFGGGGGGTSK